MYEGVDLTDLKVTFFATAVLFVKLQLALWIQGYVKGVAGLRAPEDSKGFRTLNKAGQTFRSGDSDDPVVKADVERADRWTRMVFNDLENIPIGILIAWVTLGLTSRPQLHTALVATFAGARVLYMWAFASRLQPHRAICWAIAVLAVAGLLVDGAVGILQR